MTGSIDVFGSTFLCVTFLLFVAFCGALAWEVTRWFVLRPDKNVVILRPRKSKITQERPAPRKRGPRAKKTE